MEGAPGYWAGGAAGAVYSDEVSTLPDWGSKRPVAGAGFGHGASLGGVRERLGGARLALFRGISAEELVPLAEASQTVHFEPDQHVVRQGDPGRQHLR